MLSDKCNGQRMNKNIKNDEKFKQRTYSLEDNFDSIVLNIIWNKNKSKHKAKIAKFVHTFNVPEKLW